MRFFEDRGLLSAPSPAPPYQHTDIVYIATQRPVRRRNSEGLYKVARRLRYVTLLTWHSLRLRPVPLLIESAGLSVVRCQLPRRSQQILIALDIPIPLACWQAALTRQVVFTCRVVGRAIREVHVREYRFELITPHDLCDCFVVGRRVSVPVLAKYRTAHKNHDLADPQRKPTSVSTVEYITVQYSTVHSSTVQNSTVL